MKNVVMLQNINHFNIKQILESGQVFRFEPLSESSYLLIAKQKLIKITQQQESTSPLFHDMSTGEFEEIWEPYFDLHTDYKAITEQLAKKDTYMAEAITFGKGIRILKQDPWEMLISFIISQNKSIPHIKQCITNLSQQYGEPIPKLTEEMNKYYTFPTPEQLGAASEEALRACKVGFRAPYIRDACEQVLKGSINLAALATATTQEAKLELMKIKGVGPKIADCILLFAYAKGEVFPTDVWIKRVIEGIYFDGEEKKVAYIQDFARDYFGTLAGYAQQYLFFYGRENALFKGTKK